MNTWVRVARITKPRHLEGSVVATAADALPFLARANMQVYFVPPALKTPREATVESIDQIDSETFVIHFSGIETIEDAEAISGCYCLASEDEVIWPDPEEDERTLLGYAVLDATSGLIGEVVSIEGSSAQRILCVEARSIRSDIHNQVLIPFVEEFIQNIDADTRVIHVQIPESLLHLNNES